MSFRARFWKTVGSAVVSIPKFGKCARRCHIPSSHATTTRSYSETVTFVRSSSSSFSSVESDASRISEQCA
eukprot:3033915-Amphidinium_carterae.1